MLSFKELEFNFYDRSKQEEQKFWKQVMKKHFEKFFNWYVSMVGIKEFRNFSNYSNFSKRKFSFIFFNFSTFLNQGNGVLFIFSISVDSSSKNINLLYPHLIDFEKIAFKREEKEEVMLIFCYLLNLISITGISGIYSLIIQATQAEKFCLVLIKSICNLLTIHASYTSWKYFGYGI